MTPRIARAAALRTVARHYKPGTRTPDELVTLAHGLADRYTRRTPEATVAQLNRWVRDQLRSADRNDQRTAERLLLHQDQIAVALHAKSWAPLRAFAAYVKADVPLDLARTNPERFRALRAAVTEVHIKGFGHLQVPPSK